MKIAEKFQTIAENESKVYEAGKTDGYDQGHSDGHAEGYSDGYAKGESDGFESGKTEGHEAGYTEGRKDENDAFWDGITDKGERTDYGSGFLYWGAEYIRPNRKIIPTTVTAGQQTFNHCRKLKKLEAAYFDFSQKPRGTKNSDALYYFVYDCIALEEVEDIGLQADFSYEFTFANCVSLHTIAKIRSDENTRFNATFISCRALKHLTVEGVIGQNGFNVAWSTELTHESLMSIINALKDYSNDTSGTEWIVYIGSLNLAKLTTAEREIAEKKGWNLQ